jgi:hypothetical protein
MNFGLTVPPTLLTTADKRSGEWQNVRYWHKSTKSLGVPFPNRPSHLALNALFIPIYLGLLLPPHDSLLKSMKFLFSWIIE